MSDHRDCTRERWSDQEPDHSDIPTTCRSVPKARDARFEMPGRGEAGPAARIAADGFVEAGEAIEVDQLVIEWLGRPDRVVVPLDDLAELEAGQTLAPAADQAVEVASHEVQPLLERRVGAGVAVLGPVRELAEQERVGNAPRPMEMAAQPVSRKVAAASASVRMSPLPTTGIRSTASTTARIPARLTLAREPLLAGPPVDDDTRHAHPLERAGQRRRGSVSLSQPSRILTVTGTATASTTAATSATAASDWHIRADPPPVFTTFLTGQPMLMSTAAAP